jgi:hypothetical protein
MPVSKGHSLETRDKALDAQSANRPHDQPSQGRVGLFEGIVLAVQSNSYKVGVVDEQGTVIGAVEYVRAWPDPSLDVNDKVWLNYQPGVRQPKIVVSGGSCAAGLNPFGSYVG